MLQQRLFWLSAESVVAVSLLAASLAGCKPPPPAARPTVAPNPAVANSPPHAGIAGKEAEGATVDGLPAKLVENVEQVIRLTAEYNARAEKITDRQTYVDQSGSLAKLESELSDYGLYIAAVEKTLTAAQQATLDSKYFSRAKPLIDAKKQHKERMLSLLQ
jgi:hypothetical protein